MVGYTAMSQRDEEQAIKVLDAHNALVRRVVERHGGREIKTIGDSFLLEFSSALEAVRFAVDAQDELRKFNGSAQKAEQVSVRIGIHVGDVVYRSGDVFGDAVNIASRIVKAAEGGGICVSLVVYDQVRNKVPYALEKIPSQPLKNVSSEVELYRVVLPWDVQVEVPSVSNKNRIAVMPFVNISPDPNDSYFADGLTEELISALSEVHGLRVIARTSVNYYRQSAKNVKQIGNELRVSHLLEGSVRKAGKRIRITAHLVDVETQEEVWSDNYENDLDDVFMIQSDIASRVAEALKVNLLVGEKARIRTTETESIAAYVAYLKGRSLLREGTEKAARAAREQFELAIREDGDYARAYAGLADTVLLLGDYLFAPIPVAVEEAAGFVEKAIALDPDLAEARVSLGNLLMYEQQFERAEVEFRKALEANPSYATGHQWYSVCLQTFGRKEEALRQVLLAEELDPLSPAIIISTIYRMITNGKYSEAKKRIHKLEQVDPESSLVEEGKMACSFAMADWEGAEVHLRKMIQSDPDDPFLVMDLAYLDAVTGKKKEAIGLVEKLKEVPEDARVRGQLLAFAYVGLGDFDSAFKWLDYALEKKEFFISWVRSHPLFATLRSDPRFSELLRRATLPTDEELQGLN